MTFRNFRINVLIRILLIAATLFALICAWINFDFYYNTNRVLVVLEIYSLYNFIGQIERDWPDARRAYAFLSLRSLKVEGMGSSFDEI